MRQAIERARLLLPTSRKARCRPEGVRVESLEDMQIVLVLDGMKIREACLAPRPSSQVQVCNEASKNASSQTAPPKCEICVPICRRQGGFCCHVGIVSNNRLDKRANSRTLLNDARTFSARNRLRRSSDGCHDVASSRRGRISSTVSMAANGNHETVEATRRRS